MDNNIWRYISVSIKIYYYVYQIINWKISHKKLFARYNLHFHFSLFLFFIIFSNSLFDKRFSQNYSIQQHNIFPQIFVPVFMIFYDCSSFKWFSFLRWKHFLNFNIDSDRKMKNRPLSAPIFWNMYKPNGSERQNKERDCPAPNKHKNFGKTKNNTRRLIITT